MADGTPDPPPAPLPVWQAVALGYSHIARHLPIYLTMAALWSFVVTGGLYRLIAIGFGDGPASNSDEVAVLTYNLAIAVAWLVGQVGGVIVAIAGYRAVLVGEKPSLYALASFGRRELRYLGVGLVYLALNYMVVLVAYPVLVAATGAAEGIDGGVANSLAFDLAVGLLSDLVIAPFFILALPLAALDAKPSLFYGAWQLGRGHRLRLCAVSYVAGLPFMLLTYLPRELADPDAGWLNAYLWGAIADVLGLLWVAFYSGCIALAFDWIMQRQRDRSLAQFD